MRDPADTADFFRPRLAEMIDLRHPLAVLVSRFPWPQIEAALAPHFARRDRAGRVSQHYGYSGHPFRWPGQALPLQAAPACPSASWPAFCT